MRYLRTKTLTVCYIGKQIKKNGDRWQKIVENLPQAYFR